MRIVFGIDNVLNKLEEHVYKLAGIDEKKYYKKKKYMVEECNHLTGREKKKILSLYSDENTYLTCPAQKGIDRIGRLTNIPNINIYIHSYCANMQAILGKMKWVGERIDIEGIQFIMEIGKKTPFEVDVAVESNLEYLIACKAKTKILIDKPYNKEENYGVNSKEHGIIRVGSTDEAIKFIEELVAEWTTK